MSRKRLQALILHVSDNDVPDDASRDAQPGLSGSKQPMAASVSRHQAKMPVAHSLFACAMRKGSSSGL